MNDANKSMRKMVASHNKMASVMFRKQELMEKQGKLASLWKLQEYYAAANQFAKMPSVMTQIEALTDSLAQKDDAPNDTPDDVIDINSDISVEEDGVEKKLMMTSLRMRKIPMNFVKIKK